MYVFIIVVLLANGEIVAKDAGESADKESCEQAVKQMTEVVSREVEQRGLISRAFLCLKRPAGPVE